MIKKIFIVVLLASAGITGLYAQAPTTPAAPLNLPPATPPQTIEKNASPGLIKQSGQNVIPQQMGVQQSVPDNVKKEFTAVLPNATGVTWNTREGYYEVEFTGNGKKKIRVYESNGDLKELGIQQNVKALPVGIKTYIRKNYSGETVVSVYRELCIGGHSDVAMENGVDTTKLVSPTAKMMDIKTADKDVAVKDKDVNKENDIAAKAPIKNADPTFYRVTTTSHLVYFNANGKFAHEGYEMLISRL